MKTRKPALSRFKPGDLCRLQLYPYPSTDTVPIWRADGTFCSLPSGGLVLLLGLVPCGSAQYAKYNGESQRWEFSSPDGGLACCWEHHLHPVTAQ
jgi:hypothetical protein